MKEGAREEIRLEFLSKTGIDLATYQNAEIGEAIAGLVGFPRLMIKRVLGPIFLAVLLAFAYAPFVEGVWKVVVWVGVGGLLFGVAGLVFGFWFLSRALTTYLESLVRVLLGTVSAVWRDAVEVKSRISEGTMALPSARVTTRAVAAVVVIPQFTAALTKGVILIGPLLRKPIEWLGELVVGRLLRAEEEADPAATNEEVDFERVAEAASRFEELSSDLIASSDRLIAGVRRLVTLVLIPLFLLPLALAGLLLWLFG